MEDFPITMQLRAYRQVLNIVDNLAQGIGDTEGRKRVERDAQACRNTLTELEARQRTTEGELAQQKTSSLTVRVAYLEGPDHLKARDLLQAESA
jgi:hypothetical protein